ncbi:MAG: MBL fold metallo-hydrolase, partial [Eubacteriales bacterium]|nr:MBL fold metallo-hydrolase [Eubacteriales bacterium]
MIRKNGALMKIHILTDNRVEKRGLLAEHGLSVFIEHEGFCILFDTGQSGVYLHNALQMGVDLTRTDCIVLSHGHYDHCGGLVDFPHTGRMPKIVAHKDALRKKYAKKDGDGSCHENGIPWSLSDHVFIKNSLAINQKDLAIAPGVALHGNIPVTVSFEGVSQNFFVDTGGHLEKDAMGDEQMLVIERHGGLVIFLGCSHPGVVSCLKYALSLYPGKKINTVLAGMHLKNASP